MHILICGTHILVVHVMHITVRDTHILVRGTHMLVRDTHHAPVACTFLRAPQIATVSIIRLPWSFVEELYLANGLILGSNPWALGGLYLGAVIIDS